MAVASLSTTAGAIRRPRRADPRAIVGVFLTLAALGGSVAFWVSATDSRAVLVAAHDLPAGTTLRRTDFTIANVKVDDMLYSAAVPAEMLDGLVGRRLSEPMHAEQLLVRAQVADQSGLASDQVAITIPARPDSAVDGRLRAGDSVRVLLTVADKTRGQARTQEVLERAQVFEIGRDASLSSSSLGEGSDVARGPIASVTLAVTADQAQKLAEARRSGELDILLLPPSEVPRQ